MKALTKIFDFLASFELLFILLILIIIAMSIGTVLPQQDEPETYIRFYGKVKALGETSQEGMTAPKELEIDRPKGERIYNRYRSLGLLNIYHSQWFLILSYILCFNVFLCVIKRLTKGRLFPSGIMGKVLPSWEKIKFPLPTSWHEETSTTLVEAYLLAGERLRKSGFRITKGETSLDKSHPEDNGKRIPTKESVTIVAWKGFPQKFMSLVFHLSMILSLIFCGIGSLYAFETKIMLEKDVISRDWLDRGTLASKTLEGELVGLPPSLSMSEPLPKPLDDSLKTRIDPVEALQKIRADDRSFMQKVSDAHFSMVSNPFTIDHFDRLISYPKFYGAELTNFDVEYVEYKFKPSAKDWFPTVRFVNDSGTTLYEHVAESNHPAKFKGVQYHISDYVYKFKLIVESPDGTRTVLPTEPVDGKGFAGYLSRKAYGYKTEKVTLDDVGAELTFKNIYAGKLFKTELAKEFEEIHPYVDVQIKQLETKPPEIISPAIESTPLEGVVDTIITSPDSSSTTPSANDGGMPSQAPEYVKLRTPEGYVKAGEQPLNVNGYRLYLGEINPIVEFGVRHDPGIVWFYFFGYLACIGMALKIYYPAYRLRVTIDSREDEKVIVNYHLTGWGLFSNVNSVRKNISLPKDIN